jgi:hypothetical protein
MKTKYKLDDLILTRIDRIDTTIFHDFNVSAEVNSKVEDINCQMKFYDEDDLETFAKILDMKLTVLED